MRRLWGVLLVLLGVCVCPPAHAESVLSRESLPSAALGRDFSFMVYLPEGYVRGDLRYPVLYLLHGAGGDEMAWANDGGIKATADRMMQSGDIQPSIIVMPGCRTCWWVDGARDKAETAFWTELVPAIARRYRVIEGRDGRLVAGLSAGGFGAVRFAMRYPDRIAAVAALSPAVYAVEPPAISSARRQPPFLQGDGSFDVRAWQSQNYPSMIEGYFKHNERVAFYLVSGDNDRYGIAFETMTLFKRLWGRQPDAAELRIVDGDHSWEIWSKSIENAMHYIFKYAARPKPVLVASTQGPDDRATMTASAVVAKAPQVAVRPADAQSADRQQLPFLP